MTRRLEFLRSHFDDGASVLLEGMTSWMWVPLAVKSHIIGRRGGGAREAKLLHGASR